MQATYPHVATTGAGRRWGARRITAVVGAILVGLLGLAALAGGVTALVYDQTQRDTSGYLMSGTRSFSTETYALVSGSYHAGTSGIRGVENDVVGSFRVRAHSDRPIFVGIARSADIDSYLGGVRRATATRLYAGPSDFDVQPGGAPSLSPTAKHVWAVHSVGSGTQTLSWSPRDGRWRIVVMNADGSAGVRADVAVGGRFPDLLWIGIGLTGGGLLILLLGGVAIRFTLPRRAAARATDARLEAASAAKGGLR
jgi:succinate dehydrogenase hydrophobic anchor subunit